MRFVQLRQSQMTLDTSIIVTTLELENRFYNYSILNDAMYIALHCYETSLCLYAALMSCTDMSTVTRLLCVRSN